MLFVKDKPLTVAVLALMLLIAGSGFLVMVTGPAQADVASAEISGFEISTRDGTYSVGEPLIAGVNYEIEITLDIATGVNDTIVLETGMDRKGDRYWEMLTEDYTGVNLSNWQPGQPKITFKADPGVVTFRLNGIVPEERTTTELPNEEILHHPGSVMMVNLSLQSGGPLEMRSIEVIDNSILDYRDLLSSRQQLLDDTDTISDYADLVESVIAQAEAAAEMGYTTRAIDLLELIPNSGWPKGESDSGGTDAIIYAVLGVLAALAVAAVLMVLRSRSTVGFLKQRADDQANKLDIVEARVQKLGERSLTSEIAQIRDTLRSMGRR